METPLDANNKLDQEEANSEEPQIERAQNEGSASKLNVLIVDDEEKLGRFICMLLKRSGYRPIACRSVAEARNLLVKRQWAMVLTDIVMPKENGFELVQWIGQELPHLPVIVMTAHSTEAIEMQASRLGVAAILHKPFSIDGLRQAVEETAILSRN